MRQDKWQARLSIGVLGTRSGLPIAVFWLGTDASVNSHHTDWHRSGLIGKAKLKMEPSNQILLRAVCVLVAISSSLQSSEIEVRVGPNVRVGQAKTRQAEPYIAAHPEDANSLIISTMESVDGLVGGGFTAQTYLLNLA